MTVEQVREQIGLAKERLSVLDVAERLGLDVKKRGTNQFCACVFHVEQTESCHLTKTFFKCFGCGNKGDQITLIEGAKSIGRADAIRAFLAMAGLGDGFEMPAQVLNRESRRIVKRSAMQRRGAPLMPESLHAGCPEQWAALARLRNLSEAAIEAAVRVGVLYFCEWWNRDAWLLTDKERVNARLRRMDGRPWGKGAKELCLAGSWQNWPIGISHAGNNVLLVEGSPDMLAGYALQVAGKSVDPVGMAGGAADIHAGALPMFSKKNVVIVPHNDPNGTGVESARRWLAQLQPIAGNVKLWGLPARFKDLNEFVSGTLAR